MDRGLVFSSYQIPTTDRVCCLPNVPIYGLLLGPLQNKIRNKSFTYGLSITLITHVGEIYVFGVLGNADGEKEKLPPSIRGSICSI